MLVVVGSFYIIEANNSTRSKIQDVNTVLENATRASDRLSTTLNAAVESGNFRLIKMHYQTDKDLRDSLLLLNHMNPTDGMRSSIAEVLSIHQEINPIEERAINLSAKQKIDEGISVLQSGQHVRLERDLSGAMSELNNVTKSDVGALRNLTNARARALLFGSILLGCIVLASSALALRIQHRYGRHITDESNLLKAILNSTTEGIVTIDSTGRIVNINSSASHTFGYSAREAIGQNIKMLMPERYHNMHESGLRSYLRTGVTKVIGTGVRVFGVKSDGTEFPIHLAIGESKTAEGTFFTGMIRDLSAITEAEHSAEFEAKRARSAIAATNAGVCKWWMSTNTIEMDSKFAAIFGLGTTEFADYESVVKLIAPEDQPAVEDALQSSIANNSEFDMTYRIKRGDDGELRWIRGRGLVDRGTNDEPVALVGVVWDVTAETMVADELQRAKEEAEAASQAKSQFLSSMSHELRTPLNAILGFAQLGQIQTDEPTVKKSLKQIEKGGKHLLGLITEILDIARIASGRMSVSLEPVPLLQTLREASELVSSVAERSAIRIVLGNEECEPRYALADRQRLLQVFINVLSNGIKFNRMGGTVIVSCMDSDADHFRIQFSDTGHGISASDRERLFTPFVRMAGEAQEGTGLGLALSKQLMQLMGGDLRLEETGEQGSTFEVTVARAQRPTEVALNGDNGSRTMGTFGVSRPTKVLYIEDNISNLTLVSDVFSQVKGITLLSAIQGRTGYAMATEQTPDLILLDIHLPDIDGLEVLRLLKGDPRTNDIPVVVVTADATRQLMRELTELGACGYITKPIEIDEFLETLQKLIQ